MITRKWTKMAASGAIAAAMLLSTAVQAQAAHKKDLEFLNVNHYVMTPDVKPVIVNGTVLVPLNTVKEYLKPMGLRWNNKNKTLTVNTGTDQVTLKMGSDVAKGKKKTFALSVPAQLMDGRVMVPARFMTELYDAEVRLDPKDGMVIEVEGRKRVFKDWHGGEATRKPVIHYRDVTGDGKPDVVVIYVDGTGTGLYAGEMHVVDAKSLEEIPIESLEQAVSSHVQSSIQKYADYFTVKVTVDGKESVQKFKDDSKDKSYLFDKLGFGAVVRHRLAEGRLLTEAAGNMSPAGFAGDLRITYRFNEELNRFEVDEMEYRRLEERGQ
ncbi:copper amine oxidase N-terminal domain-containing protein [Paenibacillus lautus]|uniref:Copper amine oxidase N-terminal domain-containing protein n=1 Tax=Paenibacillus lautus TaxID=1401 RepID=A0A385TSL2_PAELA|nr:copper amine oxidase N-terminal domain-containing protein [Paenibacillus lautus]AYB46789.1 copper amine oxidase N-terminal domain-containing protein [Paenibacillus lautus]